MAERVCDPESRRQEVTQRAGGEPRKMQRHAGAGRAGVLQKIRQVSMVVDPKKNQ